MTMKRFKRRPKTERYPCPLYKPNVNIDDLPKSVDWRDHGYVTAVKRQVRYHNCVRELLVNCFLSSVPVKCIGMLKSMFHISLKCVFLVHLLGVNM